VLNRCIRAGYY